MPIPQDPPPSSLLGGAALFLDFDGTLVELVDTPDAVKVPHHLVPLLDQLASRLENRLALVTGRAIRDLERYLDCSGTAVSGSHGLEIRLAGRNSDPIVAPEGLGAAAAEAERFVDTIPGLFFERKPAGITVHYRQAPEHEEEVLALMEKLGSQSGMMVQRGKMLAELRPYGTDKGDAVRAFMMEPPFAGARPLFVGDDLTDEDAFEAAAALGGAGILVGPPRESAAEWRLDGVDAVADWLKRAVAA